MMMNPIKSLGSYLTGRKTPLARTIGAKLLSIDTIFGGIFGNTYAGGVVSFGDFLKYGSGRSSVSFIACNRVAETVRGTPVNWAKDKKTRKAVPIKALDELWARPNPEWSLEAMLYLLTLHLKFTGNGFWLKEGARADGSRPTALWPLNPSRMVIVVENGLVKSYSYYLNGRQLVIPKEFIIHFRRPHPNKDFWGIGDIEGSLEFFREFTDRQSVGRNFWQRGGVPVGVMVLDTQDVNNVDMAGFKKDFEANYGGSDMGGKMAFLAGNWKYEKVGIDAAVISQIDSSKWTVEQILMAHGVPPSLVGMAVGKKSLSNGGEIKADEINYRRHTILPLCQIIEDGLDGLVQGYEPLAFACFAIEGLVDQEVIATECEAAFGMGVYSPNDVREKMGLDRLTDPAMDQHFVISTLVPIELSGINPSVPSQAAGANGNTPTKPAKEKV